MGKITLHYLGQTYDLTGKKFEDWPPEVRAIFRTEPIPKGYCEFGDWLCPRLQDCHLCGGLPDKRYTRYPYWIVRAVMRYKQKELPVKIITRQAGLFDDGKQVKVKTVYEMRRVRVWWVAAFHCFRGALWAAANEKEMGHTEVDIIKISKKKGRVQNDIVSNPDPLMVGCQLAEAA